MSAGRPVQRWLTGMAFLLPSILGFCAFTLVPLVLSFAMAFTDWDILRHNIFHHAPVKFVGLENFIRMFHDPQFWRDFGNTFFLMLGLPFAIAGSLVAALLLTRTGRRRAAVGPALVLATLTLVASGLVLLIGGMPEPAVWFLFGTLAATVLVAGVLTGGTLYRTLFYLPNFTAGVATFVLWKKLYNPHSGPINLALAPVLDGVAAGLRAAPHAWAVGLPAVCGGLGLLIIAWQARRLRSEDTDSGPVATAAGALVPAVPLACGALWLGSSAAVAVGVAVLGCGVVATVAWRRPRRYGPPLEAAAGLGTEFGLALVLVPLLTLLAAGVALGASLPVLARTGFEPPSWLGDYGWAKPALMLMALWAAIGSNNMILYLAGLSSIPVELYEAADMDGASPSQRFWHITWPLLAPVTLLISIMGLINGLQGGFEMARAMTSGGPAGATTTLSYFIFIEGFETGRLGYASAVAWFLFVLVFVLSFVNFRFGNRHAND